MNIIPTQCLVIPNYMMIEIIELKSRLVEKHLNIAYSDLLQTENKSNGKLTNLEIQDYDICLSIILDSGKEISLYGSFKMGITVIGKEKDYVKIRSNHSWSVKVFNT